MFLLLLLLLGLVVAVVEIDVAVVDIDAASDGGWLGRCFSCWCFSYRRRVYELRVLAFCFGRVVTSRKRHVAAASNLFQRTKVFDRLARRYPSRLEAIDNPRENV